MDTTELRLRNNGLSGDVVGILGQYQNTFFTADLSHNRIFSIGRFSSSSSSSCCAMLHSLNLSSNIISDLDELIENIGQFEELRELDLRDNPVTSFYFTNEEVISGQNISTFLSLEDYDSYCSDHGFLRGERSKTKREQFRLSIINKLHSLEVLDGIKISPSERTKSYSFHSSSHYSASILEDFDSILEGIPSLSSSSPSPPLNILPDLNTQPEATERTTRSRNNSYSNSNNFDTLFSSSTTTVPAIDLGSSTFFEDISRRLAKLGEELSFNSKITSDIPPPATTTSTNFVHYPIIGEENRSNLFGESETDLDTTVLSPLFPPTSQEEQQPTSSLFPQKKEKEKESTSVSVDDIEQAVKRALQPVINRLELLEQFAVNTSTSMNRSGSGSNPSPNGNLPISPVSTVAVQTNDEQQQQPEQTETTNTTNVSQTLDSNNLGVRILKQKPSGIAFSVPHEEHQNQQQHQHQHLRRSFRTSQSNSQPKISPRKQQQRQQGLKTPTPAKQTSIENTSLGLTLLLPKCFNQRQRDETETICMNLVQHLLSIPASDVDLPRKILSQSDIEFQACARLVNSQSCQHLKYECTKVTRLYQKQDLWKLVRLDGCQNIAGLNVRVMFNAVTNEKLISIMSQSQSQYQESTTKINEDDTDEPLLLGTSLAINDSISAENETIHHTILRLVKIGSWELYEGDLYSFETNHERIFTRLRNQNMDGIVLNGPEEDLHLRQFFYCLQPNRCVASYSIEYHLS